MSKSPLFRGDPEVAAKQRLINRWLAEQGLPVLEIDGIDGLRTEAAYSLMLMRSDAGGVGTELPVPPAAIPWWTSRAIWGSLAGIVAGGAGLVGWSLDAEQLSSFLIALVSLISAAVTFWGTLRRRAPIDQTLVASFDDGDIRLPSRLPAPPVSAAHSGSDAHPSGPFWDER